MVSGDCSHHSPVPWQPLQPVLQPRVVHLSAQVQDTGKKWSRERWATKIPFRNSAFALSAIGRQNPASGAPPTRSSGCPKMVSLTVTRKWCVINEMEDRRRRPKR